MNDIHIPGTLPEKVKNGIGRKGWSALSWAVYNNWVGGYKWLFSEIAGHDIGTPCTVQTMLLLSGLMSRTNCFFLLSEEMEAGKLHKVGTRGLFMFSERVERHQVPAFYQLLVEGHLIGTDFISRSYKKRPDNDGDDQLEGELRRFCRLPRNILNPQLAEIGKSRNLPITKEVVAEFCHYAFLPYSFQSFCEELKIDSK
jgi:hypothetical protein